MKQENLNAKEELIISKINKNTETKLNKSLEKISKYIYDFRDSLQKRIIQLEKENVELIKEIKTLSDNNADLTKQIKNMPKDTKENKTQKDMIKQISIIVISALIISMLPPVISFIAKALEG